jgi:hypothetical protein
MPILLERSDNSNYVSYTVIKTNRIPPLISTRILVFSVTMVVASFVLNHSEQQLAWANDEGGCLAMGCTITRTGSATDAALRTHWKLQLRP